MLKDFKAFISRGNVVDLAVGVIIGAAFGKVVTSFVNDVLMPPIGLLLGHTDFSNLFVTLGQGNFATIADAKKAGVPTLNYGVFINTLIEFLIVAFAVFLLIQAIGKMLPKPAAPAATKPCPMCAMNIPLAAKRCPDCTSELTGA